MSVEVLAGLAAFGGFLVALFVRVGSIGSYIARIENAERRGVQRDADIDAIKRELGALGQRVAHIEGVIERRHRREEA